MQVILYKPTDCSARDPYVIKQNVFFHAWHKDEENITWNTVSLWHGIMKLTYNGFVIE